MSVWLTVSVSLTLREMVDSDLRVLVTLREIVRWLTLI